MTKKLFGLALLGMILLCSACTPDNPESDGDQSETAESADNMDNVDNASEQDQETPVEDGDHDSEIDAESVDGDPDTLPSDGDSDADSGAESEAPVVTDGDTEIETEADANDTQDTNDGPDSDSETESASERVCLATLGNCYIKGICYPDNTGNPQNACEYCSGVTAPTGWTPRVSGTLCDDGAPCTFNDVCDSLGHCAGTSYTCTSPGPCEKAAGAVCLGTGECRYVASPGKACDDDDPCTTNDVCAADKTCSGIVTDCTSLECSSRTCEVCMTGGGPVAAGTFCNDGNPCTKKDACDANANCVGISYTCNSYGTCDGHGGCPCTDSHMAEGCTACSFNFAGFPNCVWNGNYPLGYCENHICSKVTPTSQGSCIFHWWDGWRWTSSGGACSEFAGTWECPNTAYCGQDAEYPDNRRTYTCYSAAGIATDCASLPIEDEQVVVDSMTGLTWSRIYLGGLEGETWQMATDHCNSMSYGGYDDWHLPTVAEMISLYNYQTFNPSIDIAAFPGTPIANFWTSTPYAGDGSYAWVGYFSTGTISYISKTSTAITRCVRGGPIEKGHETLNALGLTTTGYMVTDAVTGLIWQNGYESSLNWGAALSHCEKLQLGGMKDWRTPNIKELASLQNYGKANPASDFPDIPPNLFWSSTSAMWDGPTAFVADFNSGSFGNYPKESTASVRCVRGGP